MPRPKPKTASAVFFARAHSLSDTQKNQLLELLRYDADSLKAAEIPGYQVLKREPGAPLLVAKVPKSDAPIKNPYDAILYVESALGLGVEGAQHLDNIPRPADYREAFRPVGRTAWKLLNTLTSWTEYFCGQFTLRGQDIHEVERALAILVDVSAAVTRDMAGKSSKGARKQNALTEVIRRLRRTFRDYYQGKRTERNRQGAFESLAQWEKDELAFVDTALLAARLVRKGHYDLPRLFRDPRCALPEERAKVVERIARKVHSSSAREKKRGQRLVP